MRTTILALAIFATGCTTTGTSTNKIQPAPKPYRDHKTPVAPGKPVLSQRVAARRLQDARVARGNLAVEGQLTR